MTIQFTGRDTRELVAVIEQYNRPRTFLLDKFFTGAVYSENQYLDIEEILRGRHMAPIVHEDHPGRDVRSGGFNLRSFEPPLMKPLEVVNPQRTIKRMAGEPMGGDLSPAERYELIKLDMMLEQRKSSRRRMEWYASRLMRTGSISVTGFGYKQPITINFQRDAELTVALTTTARWGESGVKPDEDIEDWMQRVQDKSGFAPTDIIFEAKAWRLAKPFYKDVLDNRRQAGGQLELGPVNIGDHVSDARYLGSLGDLDFWLYQETVEDDSGSIKLMPDYTVILGSAYVEGVQGYGALLSKAHGFMPLEFGPRIFEDVKLDRDYVEGQCKGMPMLGRPDACLTATVR